MEIKEFLKQTKQQYVDLLISSGFANENQRQEIEKHLEIFNHGKIVDSLKDTKAELKIDRSSGEPKPIFVINKNSFASLENIADFNDKELDSFKQVMFHEFTHALQFDKQLNKDVGYNKGEKYEGSGANEVSAVIVEQATMLEYLKKVRGLENPGIINRPVNDRGIIFNTTQIVEDVNNINKDNQFRVSSYFRELALVNELCKNNNIDLKQFALNSFSINENSRQSEVFDKVPNIENFLSNLTTVLIYSRHGESEISRSELNQAVQDIRQSITTQQGLLINEFGEIERNGNEQTFDFNFPTFKPPENENKNEQSLMINEYGEIVRGDGSEFINNTNIPTFTPPPKDNKSSMQDIEKSL